MKRNLASILAAAALLLAACAPAATPALSAVPPSAAVQPVDLTVFAAASLTDAYAEIKTNFEAAHPGVTVIYNFGGSNALAQQLGEGAPADVFASANSRQMEVAVESGRVAPESAQVFVRNRLVVITPADSTADVATLRDLANPGLKLILAARDVPVGQYSLDFLDKAAADASFGAVFKDAVLANVVSYEDNVRSVLTKVALGEGDAGIVYTSDIVGDPAKDVVSLEIPDALNTIATYPIAPVVDSARAELARAFIDYVLSAEGQAILENYGFLPAGGGSQVSHPAASLSESSWR